MMATSLGPAHMSTPTMPHSSRFASATYRLPGPTIFSTAGMVSVPYAIAATACAPPTLNTRCTPASRAATSTEAGMLPSCCGGVQRIISSTPATRAGTAFMITVLG
jgi:hypothetical protein